MTSQEIALREAVDGAVVQLRDPDFAAQIALAVPEGISAQKLLRAAATAVLDNPQLAAPNLRPSLIRATLKTAQDGLLPDGREAAFVIFTGRNPGVAYMPMIGGLRKIAAEHGIAIQTGIVHENDSFDPDFESGAANFKRAKLGTNRGSIIGAYAQAQHRDGRRWLEVMDVADIERIRMTSRAKDSGPWKDWWDRMAEKSVARKLFKSLPLDPKDAERLHRVLSEGLNGEQAIETLYGAEDRPGSPPVDQAVGPGDAPAAEGSPAHPSDDDEDIPFGDTEPEFIGEEPDFLEGEIVEEPTFGGKKHAGKTVQEVWDLGDEGRSYVRWARRNWKTGDIVGALERFAQEHPEIDA